MKKGRQKIRPKLVHKQKRNSTKKQGLLVKFFTYIFRKLFSILSSIFFLCKKNPRVLPIFCTALFSTLIIFVSISKIKSYSEKLLPTSLSLEINNPQLYNLVNNDISKAILNAQKIHEKRSHFLKRVDNILYSYDQIDQYWIRLGFDRKLQISVTPQVPLLNLETKGGDKYVISSTSKIIAKNPNSFEYPGLYTLSAPEIKIFWRSKLSQQKNKLNFSTKEPVNLTWLVHQTRVIYSNFQELGLNYLLTKVVWNNSAGFQLILIEASKSSSTELSSRGLTAGSNHIPVDPAVAPSGVQRGDTIISPTVLLGRENLVYKTKQLKVVLDDLSKKNLRPAEIDLDYTDKASFKL